jgi:UDPglucose 6-dehydrogenase
MELLIVGVGYVGLVTGSCFAEMGHHVTCLDIDENRIANLKQGIIPFYEPHLKELALRNAHCNRLTFTTNWKESVERAQVCFLCVPTPSLADGSCDLSYLFDAASQIALHMENYKVIVNKSTVPVGSASQVCALISHLLKERGVDIPFDVVSNPEFLKEGSAVNDCLKPDRIIIGTKNPHSAKIMKEIYSPFTVNHDRVICMDIPSAELTKYAANAMLATRISFMNELAALSEEVGANIHNVRIGIGSDSRIGYHFLYAGTGYGGSCFPKDLRALMATAKQHEIPTPILEAVEQVNEQQKRLLSTKIAAYFQDLSDKTIAIWGLSFKPDTDDIREAPSLCLIQDLLAQGAHVRAFDPVSIPNAQKVLSDPNLLWCRDEYDAATGADAIVLVTEWKQFRSVNFRKLRPLMRHTVLFDGRNQYRPQEMHQLGFEYFGIGVSSLHLYREPSDFAHTARGIQVEDSLV